jgi:hypothetical protein
MPTHNKNNNSNKRSNRGKPGRRRAPPTGYSSRISFSGLSRSIDKRPITIVQATAVNYPYVPNTGINGVGAFDICFAITQASMIYSQSNAAWTTLSGTFENYAQLAAVYQEYRIMRLEVDLYYSCNSQPSNATLTGGALPMVYAIQDREDARAITSVVQMLQYASCIVMQGGNSSGTRNGRQTITMEKPSCFVLNDNDASLIGTASASQLQYSPWLSCGTNSSGSTAAVIPHGYIKFYVDPVGCTDSVAVGAFTFVFRAIFQYRGVD